MAILTREEFFQQLQNHIGTDSSDETIRFMEDMTDTYNDLDTRANVDGRQWEQKYKELDESWKKRYQHRFFNSGGGNPGPRIDTPEREREEITIDELFK